MNEQFTKFKRKEFIKMWRTMKAETGYRYSTSDYNHETQSIRSLMERYEERMFIEIENKRKWYKW